MVNFYDSTSKVSLSIVDYEFENAPETWDLNWLVVSVERVDNDNKVLVKKEPALLTCENRGHTKIGDRPRFLQTL